MMRRSTSLLIVGALTAGLVPLLVSPANAVQLPTRTWAGAVAATRADAGDAGGLSIIYDSHIVSKGMFNEDVTNHSVFRTDAGLSTFTDSLVQKVKGEPTRTSFMMPGVTYVPASEWLYDGWGSGSGVYLKQVNATVVKLLGFKPSLVSFGTGDTVSTVFEGYTYGCEPLFNQSDCTYSLSPTDAVKLDGSGIWKLSVTSSDKSMGSRNADVTLNSDGSIVSYATPTPDVYSSNGLTMIMSHTAVFSYGPQPFPSLPPNTTTASRVVNLLASVGIPAGGTDILKVLLSSATSSLDSEILATQANNSRTPVRDAFRHTLSDLKAQFGKVWQGTIVYTAKSYLFTFKDTKTGASFVIPVSRSNVARHRSAVGMAHFHWGNFNMDVPAHLIF